MKGKKVEQYFKKKKKKSNIYNQESRREFLGGENLSLPLRKRGFNPIAMSIANVVAESTVSTSA